MNGHPERPDGRDAYPNAAAGQRGRAASSRRNSDEGGGIVGQGLRLFALFVTGAATLALQLIASRILTPYFGVSLYIWTGILVVTLVALAAGYALGGWLSNGRRPGDADGMFGTAPAVAGGCLAFGALVYPNLFPLLARLDLALGAILASVVLLGPALVILAGMNPLLVATFRRGSADAGSGNVFAWSTAGSVIGVLAAAFVFIPHLTNFSSLLAVAVALATVSAGWAVFSGRPREDRIRAVKAAVIAVLMAVLSQGIHFGLPGRPAISAFGYDVVTASPSAHGTVRVVDIPAQAGETDRVMLVDGMNMGMQRLPAENGVAPASIGFPHALTAIARQRNRSQGVLVLGLGIGSVPMMLTGEGYPVDAVEISPTVVDIATDYFGFDPGRVPVHEVDARIFARHCPGDDGQRYDAILVDLFAGDGIPDHLVTREFFEDLRSCLTPGGTVAFNTIATANASIIDSDLLATVVSVFGMTTVIEDVAPGSDVGNAYLASPPMLDPEAATFDEAPAAVRDGLIAAFAGAERIGASDLGHGRVLTDENNRFVVSARQEQMTYRRHIVESLPPALLLN
ncbi:fused MFS/spermidine synthase [Fodinicurvata sp. EGI_FJ10296]|uniref:fused MFS/spermidine synthase n=1 Tax=Fodinicurvata sp. EGI_FJ10296 TaxID=3231908 RepID=UPI003455E4D4